MKKRCFPVFFCLFLFVFSSCASRFEMYLHSASLPEAESTWEIREYEQGFGYQFGSRYLAPKDGMAKGTFSNDVTKNGIAFLDVFVNKDDIAFELYEFDSKLPVALKEFEKFRITINAEGAAGYEKVDFGSAPYYAEDGKKFVLRDVRMFKALCEHQVVGIDIRRLDHRDRVVASYYFKIQSGGLGKAYYELVGKKSEPAADVVSGSAADTSEPAGAAVESDGGFTPDEIPAN